jgi:hypothetical protein
VDKWLSRGTGAYGLRSSRPLCKEISEIDNPHVRRPGLRGVTLWGARVLRPLDDVLSPESLVTRGSLVLFSDGELMESLSHRRLEFHGVRCYHTYWLECAIKVTLVDAC